ncbi:MAG: FAD-binding oxidoreductase [Planctomycetales bacterium]|nr:FAD-binding oxidoreductase [Planctomycetales bacterium]
MNRSADVVIVGGGVWGLSAAYQLSRMAGVERIIVLERNATLATETTKQAAGQIGQLRSDPLMIEAVGYTLSLLNGFQEETGYDPEFVCTGSLHIAQCNERFSAFKSQIPNAREHGIEVSVATDEQIAHLAPAINTEELVGAIYVEKDGYVNTYAWANALANAAVDRGVEIELNADVKSIGVANDRIIHVQTEAETIATERAIVTCGPWTRDLANAIGFSIPAVPIRLQQTRTLPDPNLPKHHPVVRIPDQSCYLRPENGGYLYGFFDPDPWAMMSAKTTTSEIPLDSDLYAESTRRLAPLFPILKQLEVSEHRRGMVTCTPDANYVIGPLPEVGGLYVATGCGAMGVAGSGAVGRWLANYVVDGNAGADLSKLAPNRFGDAWNDSSLLEDKCRDVFSKYYALKSATYNMAGNR